jgi:hypothetical protein
MEPWMMPFARTIDAARKYVVSSTLERVDWNAELVRGDLAQAVQHQRKRHAAHEQPLPRLPLELATLPVITHYYSQDLPGCHPDPAIHRNEGEGCEAA